MEQMFFPVTQKKASKTGVEWSSVANKNAIFPTQLRDLRREKGVSQDELSKILGVSKSTLGLWETGDTLPDARSLHDLAVYYGVSADYLLGLTDVQTSDVNVKTICGYTGLSEKTCNWLVTLNDKHPKNEDIRQGINAILESDEIENACLALFHMLRILQNIPNELPQMSKTENRQLFEFIGKERETIEKVTNGMYGISFVYDIAYEYRAMSKEMFSDIVDEIYKREIDKKPRATRRTHK